MRVRGGVVVVGEALSLLKVEDMDSLSVEYLGLIDPSLDSGGDIGYGKDHLSNLLVKFKGKLADKVELILHSSFHG